MAMAITAPHYTIDDLANFPDDGNRYELLDGVLLGTPAPNLSVHRPAAPPCRVGSIVSASAGA